VKFCVDLIEGRSLVRYFPQEKTMFSEAIRAQMAKSIRYVEPADISAAKGEVAALYAQMERDFMVAPLLTLHASMPKLMAGVWSILRESLMAGEVERVRKEIVAAAVSKSNECPFCVEAHTLMLHATADHDIAEAIKRGDYHAVQDPELQALLQWSLATRKPKIVAMLPQPFSAHEAPEITGTAIAFHYINRMANVFLGDSLLPLPGPIRTITHRLYAATAGKKVVRSLTPGASLRFVSEAQLPAEFAWAEQNQSIAKAFAGFAATVEEAGEVVLPANVRELVNERLAEWHGEDMPISRRWVEDAVSDLPETDRAAARLALLVALASYQIDDEIIEAFRYHYPFDAHLISASAWASLAAARRISSWLHAPTPEVVLAQ
jgi:AhpD family alkylhydroperoxidase